MLLEVAIVVGALRWDIFPSAQHSYGLLTATELFYFFAGPEHFAVVLGEPRLSAGVFGIVETVDVKKAGKQYISALRAFLHVRERRLGLIKYGVLYETFHPSVHLVTLRVLPGLQ